MPPTNVIHAHGYPVILPSCTGLYFTGPDCRISSRSFELISPFIVISFQQFIVNHNMRTMKVATFSPVILMLEQDPDDRFITSSVFEENQYKAHLEFVNNVEGLFAYLDRCRQTRSPYPAMILINLHTTPQDGREILKQLKENDLYKHIPVIVLSGSKDPAMARECYVLGASSFIQKPALLSETNEKIASFFRYWFKTVELT